MSDRTCHQASAAQPRDRSLDAPPDCLPGAAEAVKGVGCPPIDSSEDRSTVANRRNFVASFEPTTFELF